MQSNFQNLFPRGNPDSETVGQNLKLCRILKKHRIALKSTKIFFCFSGRGKAFQRKSKRVRHFLNEIFPNRPKCPFLYKHSKTKLLPFATPSHQSLLLKTRRYYPLKGDKSRFGAFLPSVFQSLFP